MAAIQHFGWGCGSSGAPVDSARSTKANIENHTFEKDICKVCGVSSGAANRFRWECVPKTDGLIECRFCGARNRLPVIRPEQQTLVCGSCNNPLFSVSPETKPNLAELVGLLSIKQECDRLFATVRHSKRRAKMGLPTMSQTLHFVFQGAPGTGKTEVARLLASGLKDAGILEKGQLIETDRAGLVGQYLGHTEEKVLAKCQEALGGVLFIDEAYSLNSQSEDSFGRSAIDTLLKFMEDHRDKIVVIVAGYKELMAAFIASNPGLHSRFTRYMDFPDYSISELAEIFARMINRGEYTLSKTARSRLPMVFQLLTERNSRFGNARGVRNTAERIFAIQAERLDQLDEITPQQMSELLSEDFDVLLTEAGIPRSDLSWANDESSMG